MTDLLDVIRGLVAVSPFNHEYGDCLWCYGGTHEHEPDCVFALARDLVAQNSGATP